MALINCNDCGAEVSDSAPACPKCGAPTPKKTQPSPGNIFCPFCVKEISEDANVCHGCNARKAYSNAGSKLYGKWATIGWGLGMPVVLMAVFPPAGIILVPLILYVIYRLFKGPVWYQTRDL